MKRYFKSVLSFALILALMLSLGVAAFADAEAKQDDEEEKEIEIIDIGFNLCTGEAVAVRMRELVYDDIRLNGISYKAEAKDGVILIELGDLAVAKILTEKKAEAQEAGIDLSRVYIRGGKALINADGLSAEEAASLKAAVDEFLTANRLSVSIGDIFDLSNGDEVKLKLRVVSFYYPQLPKEKDVKVMSADEFEKWADSENGKIDTPNITTVYIYYEGTQFYNYEIDNDDGGIKLNGPTQDLINGWTYRWGFLSLAKAKGDAKTYYIQRINGTTTEDWEEMADLSADGNGKITLDQWASGELLDINTWAVKYYPGYFETSGLFDVEESFDKIIISTDKKNTYKEFTFKDGTPKAETLKEVLLKNAGDKKKLAAELEKLGYVLSEENGDITLTPINSAVVTEVKAGTYEVVYMDVFNVRELTSGTSVTTLAAPAGSMPVAAASPSPSPVAGEPTDNVSENDSADKEEATNEPVGDELAGEEPADKEDPAEDEPTDEPDAGVNNGDNDLSSSENNIDNDTPDAQNASGENNDLNDSNGGDPNAAQETVAEA